MVVKRNIISIPISCFIAYHRGRISVLSTALVGTSTLYCRLSNFASSGSVLGFVSEAFVSRFYSSPPAQLEEI
ncbi:hypothetical protein J6590_039613 [Homalodisca vitripennis]|nr:hypothetical protein J6590_039613 [Homalodisca vitripennis]